MSELRHHLATRLRFHRRARRLTQRQLSQLCGVSRSTISRLERGEAVGSPSTVDRIARALRIQPEELTGVPGQREAFPSTAEQRLEIIRAVVALSDADLDRVHPLVMEALSLAEETEDS